MKTGDMTGVSHAEPFEPGPTAFASEVVLVSAALEWRTVDRRVADGKILVVRDGDCYV